jgi:hypothetical protein
MQKREIDQRLESALRRPGQCHTKHEIKAEILEVALVAIDQSFTCDSDVELAETRE